MLTWADWSNRPNDERVNARLKFEKRLDQQTLAQAGSRNSEKLTSVGMDLSTDSPAFETEDTSVGTRGLLYRINVRPTSFSEDTLLASFVNPPLVSGQTPESPLHWARASI